MSRRAVPKNIDLARRAAVAERLRDSGMLPEVAERWLVAWERLNRVATDRDDRDFWDRSVEWIANEYAAGRRPPL
jgi:hypothetical protein